VNRCRGDAVVRRCQHGGESRNIDLRGSGKRSLSKVEFWYDSAGLLNGKAEVKLFGQR